MPGMFCRHNRLTSKCPICSRELEENLRAQAPVRHVTPRKTGASSTPRSKTASPRSSGRLVTRKLARAADDGYRNPLVPGLKATADAERLAHAVTAAHARLDPPGPFTAIDETPDVEQATWLAFLFALAPELYDLIDETRPAYGVADGLPEAKQRTDRRLPRLGRARRLAGGRLHRRGELEPRAPLRPRLRAARAPRLHARHALRPADRPRRRRHLSARRRRAALRRGRRPDDARRQARAGVRRPDAARAPRPRSRRRVRAPDRRL